MPKIGLPQANKVWKPNYANQFSGDYGKSFNINLKRRPCFATVSLPLVAHTTEDDIATMGMPTDFAYAIVSASITSLFAVGSKIIRTTDFTANKFFLDNIAGVPTTGLGGDLKNWGKNSTGYDMLVASISTGVALLNTTWSSTYWTTTLAQPSLSSAPILNVFQTTLVMGEGRYIHTITKPGISPAAADVTVQYQRVILPTGYTINWIQSTKDKVYIGATGPVSLGPSLFIEYDLLAEQTREVVMQEGKTIGFVVNNQCWLIDAKGTIKQWNGSGFTVIDAFPLAYKEERLITIHRNGIVVSDNKIFFNVLGDNQYMIGGIWSYDLNMGVLSQETTLRNSTALSYGESQSSAVGGLFVFNEILPDKTFFLFAGATTTIASFANLAGVFISDSTATIGTIISNIRGWIITPKFTADVIDNIWRNVLIKYDYDATIAMGTTSLDGTILVKCRNVDIDNLNNQKTFTSTWVTGSSFTISAVNAALWLAGDEIFILSGNGEGLSAHILSITIVAGTATVVIDETISGSPSGTFKMMIDRWKKIKTFTVTVNTAGYQLVDIPDTQGIGDWVQFKIELRGGAMFDELSVGYQPNLVQEP